MAQKIKKTGSGLLIASIVIVVVVLINFRHIKGFAYKVGSDFFYPFLEAPSEVSEKVNVTQWLTKSKEELAAAADRYKKANDKLLSELASIEDLRSENLMLRNLLSIPERAHYKHIFAQVLVRDPAHWEVNFTINKGSNDGIIPGSPVLTRRYTEEGEVAELAIVGRIVEDGITKHTAVVSTIFNQTCELSVKLPSSKTHGIISGGERKGGMLWANIKYLPRDLPEGKKYEAGEPVYTSGLTKWTPPSLYVGTLSGDRSAKIKVHDNLFVEAQMDPAVDINNIKFVMIMVRVQE